jgi:hypothetical protein
VHFAQLQGVGPGPQKVGKQVVLAHGEHFAKLQGIGSGQQKVETHLFSFLPFLHIFVFIFFNLFS